ncbi:hypothetical protein [Streptomyces sp. SS]|uniref:hypothetical protein n=1 Tax=Streptomyces sp. SS TaxID=260742 RepID=UPI0002E2D171|nr:hypothetical protein [Streptomyces sp. SS]
MNRSLSTLAVLGAAGLLMPLAPVSYAAQAAPAEQSVPVLNGDFADPVMKGDGPTTVGIDFWTGLNQRYSPAASGRTDASHGVALQKDGNTLRQRLRGVRAGARVTVTYEDSPAVSKECTGAEVVGGQPYEVTASGGPAQQVTTAGDPDRTKGKPGPGRWTGRSYVFTAGENDPLLTFTSRVTDSRTHVTCSPMIARIRAVEVPPALDKTVDKTRLGTSEAYKGNDRESTLHNAAAACNGENACVFRPDARMSFRYYDKARVVGEAFVNCTRNTLEHSRLLSYAERSHDSIAQTYADAGLALNEVARLPTSGDRAEDEKRARERPMAAQFALAYEKGWERPWQWFSEDPARRGELGRAPAEPRAGRGLVRRQEGRLPAARRHRRPLPGRARPAAPAHRAHVRGGEAALCRRPAHDHHPGGRVRARELQRQGPPQDARADGPGGPRLDPEHAAGVTSHEPEPEPGPESGPEHRDRSTRTGTGTGAGTGAPGPES